MADDEQLEKTINLEEARKKFLHLDQYINEFEKKHDKITFVEQLTREMGANDYPNVIYPVGDPIFIHVFREYAGDTQYIVIEPKLDGEDLISYNKCMDKLIDIAYKNPVPDKINDIGPVLIKLLEQIVDIKKGNEINKKAITKIQVTQETFEKIKYFLIRNRVGYSKLEPLFHDPNLEDIHCTGVGRITTVHKIFGMVYTNIEFANDDELDRYIIEVTERVERPTSDRQSIVDAIMPDGSRANFIFGRDISQEGSSFTVRKFSKIPVSITQLISWNTVSPELAAYIWIALENGMNLFICGETASGKTTTLNAMAAFIKPDAKIYTVENTPEVTMPHDIWQHLVTREAGKDSDVSYLDLLIASLRSRPNYIIVGEIRGAEGGIAFQAMQTGHPVLSTFHAGNVNTMIQRLTGDPINVPIAFVDNLNLSLIQQAVYKGNKFVRRVLSLTELERYYAPANKVVTREVFTWNPVTDKIAFRGLFNSYILEQKIAKILGYDDPRKIYGEMDKRAKILRRMTEEKIYNYFDVWKIIKDYHNGGPETLPFKI